MRVGSVFKADAVTRHVMRYTRHGCCLSIAFLFTFSFSFVFVFNGRERAVCGGTKWSCGSVCQALDRFAKCAPLPLSTPSGV